MNKSFLKFLKRESQFFECQVKDRSNNKNKMNKMETRIRELESEVVTEARRRTESQNNLRKSERRIQEMTYSSGETKKNHERMEALVDQLQSQMKSYR